MDYSEFIQSKQILHPDCGIDIPQAKLSRKLFQFQRDACHWALRKGRAAIFFGCGLGKTLIQVEWARRIGGPGIILAPLAVNAQTVFEAQDKLHVSIVNARQECDEEKIITNYGMMQHFNFSRYRWIVCDESSIIKNFTGHFRNLIIESTRCIPYRLACTATPAPNDIMEIGNHSEFLGNLSRTEMLSTFFVHDGGDTGKWRLKAHAKKDFYKWLSGFCIVAISPKDLGYDQEGFELPELRQHIVITDCGDKQIVEDDTTRQITMWPGEAKTLGERRAARSQTVEERAAKVAEIVAQSPEDQFLIWCNLNRESEAAVKAVPGSVEITGSQKPEVKERLMMDFISGKIRYLVTKPDIAGFGLNLQNCHKVIFFGLSDSWESKYQAERRSYRFGQKHPVDSYIVISSLEGNVLKNIQRKESQAEEMYREMVSNMHELNKNDLQSNKRQGDVYEPKKEMILPAFAQIKCEMCGALPERCECSNVAMSIRDAS